MVQRFLLLPAFASLVLVVACSSSGSGELHWRDLTQVPGAAYPGLPTPPRNIEGMERIGGFPFVFPSFVPEGLNAVKFDAWGEGTTTVGEKTVAYGAGEQVTIGAGEGTGLTFVRIDEWTEPFPEGLLTTQYPPEQHVVGDIEVTCAKEGSDTAVDPAFNCQWVKADKLFYVFFRWSLDKPAEGLVSEEMRDEAMKVVESMILAPEHP